MASTEVSPTATDGSPRARSLSARDPVLFAMLLGLTASLVYTASNSCLRACTDLDPLFVSWAKALPLVAIYLPWWILRLRRGKEAIPPLRAIGILVIAGVIGQLGGNVLFQWSLGVVGLALSVAVCLASMTVSAAVLGKLFLGESVSPRTRVALVVIVTAVGVLFLGARAAPLAVGTHAAAEAMHPWAWAAAGTGAAFASGVAYTVLGTLIRKCVTGKTSVIGTLWVTGLTGAVVLGIGASLRVSPAAVASIEPSKWLWLLLAGLFNAIAFFALIRSLQLAPVVIVNAVNASQSASAAVAGVLLFAEPLTPYLFAGIGLTAVGFLMLRPPGKAPKR
ncbi:MAG TPA: DMT family transporter [Pirellulaceae bacterium]|nr:DMT family transporter [Pirellulaceae bacterium]